MTIEEAIRILEEASDGYFRSRRYPERVYAIRSAIKALHTQQEAEKNDPLTLDELREMDGDKIYVKFIGILKEFYDDGYAPYYGRHEQYIQKYNGMLRACDLPLKYYGESWLAYRYKPEDDNYA